VWRKLKAPGALYVQQSVCLLPDRPEVTRQARLLVEHVRRGGGDGRGPSKMQVNDPAEDADKRAQLNAARDDEERLADRVPGGTAPADAERAAKPGP
jgi:hypothetical protein